MLMRLCGERVIKNVLELTVVMVRQLCEYTKRIDRYTSKGNTLYVNYISVKLS